MALNARLASQLASQLAGWGGAHRWVYVYIYMYICICAPPTTCVHPTTVTGSTDEPRHGIARHSTARHGTARHGTAGAGMPELTEMTISVNSSID